MNRPILIGAVAYDPRVVPIWEGMRDYFRETPPEIDYVLFSNYDRQVKALLKREIDIAWNTNLAWIKLQKATNNTCRALAMRDVDAGFTTVFVARSDSGVQYLKDVAGKRLALGSADSAQAAILPLHFLHEHGVDAERDCSVLRFNLDVGKHGDTGTSELEVLKALQQGDADVGVLGDTTWIRQTTEGKIDTDQIKAFWTSPGYCHCNFSVLEDFPADVGRKWVESLLEMKYEKPRWRELMDLEGLKLWLPTDEKIMKGYGVLADAVQQQGLDKKWPDFEMT